MAQLEGDIDKNKPQHICKLNRALYDLKQAPKVWYERRKNVLLGFKNSS